MYSIVYRFCTSLLLDYTNWKHCDCVQTARTKILLFCCPHTQNTNICEIIWWSLFNHNKLLNSEIVDISLSQAVSSTVMIIFSLSTSPEFYPIFIDFEQFHFSDPSSLRSPISYGSNEQLRIYHNKLLNSEIVDTSLSQVMPPTIMIIFSITSQYRNRWY